MGSRRVPTFLKWRSACVLNVTFPQQRIQPTLITPSLKKRLFDLNPAIWNVSSPTWAKLAFKQNKISGVHVHYVVQSFHTGASLYLLRRCVWEYVPVSFLCLCCRWIGRCQCFVYFSTYQWNKKNLNETFGKFLKSSLFTLLSLAVYYVIYLLSGDHGSRCNKR